MEERFLEPLPVEFLFDIMSPQPPPSLQYSRSNHTNIHSTFTTIAQQVITNITQEMIASNFTDSETTNSLVRYRTLYRNYHGMISTFVCIFGLTCNLFNIIVLTRPLMRSSTNTILTSLALSDLIKMLFVLPASILFYCLQPSERKSEPDFTSRFQVTFYMIQMLVALSFHCISTWLTVLLAGFRYVFLSWKKLSGFVSTPDRALIGVSIVVIISTILCIPSYIEHRIVEEWNNQTNASKVYRYEVTNLSRSLSLRDTVFVLHSVIFKLIPCVLLLLFSFLLIQQLRNALKNAKQLQKHSISAVSSMNSARIRGRRREQENRRTTLMLVIVCALFLVTELPQGAILLLAFIWKKDSKYYYQIYQQLGDTFDILALINNSVNFILYCLMSRAFRDTFKQTFCFPCQKFDRRGSTVSFAQLSVIKKRQDHLPSSVLTGDHIPTYNNSKDQNTIPLLNSNGFESKNFSDS